MRWSWEVPLPELKANLFVLPGDATRYGQKKAIVLNGVARRIVESLRGTHRELLFTCRGERLKEIENNAWRRAWRNAGLPVEKSVARGVHKMRHTFAHRLKAVGVTLEDSRVLLEHGKANVTENYSLPDLSRLLQCVERIEHRTETVMLRPVNLAKS